MIENSLLLACTTIWWYRLKLFRWKTNAIALSLCVCWMTKKNVLCNYLSCQKWHSPSCTILDFDNVLWLARFCFNKFINGKKYQRILFEMQISRQPMIFLLFWKLFSCKIYEMSFFSSEIYNSWIIWNSWIIVMVTHLTHRWRHAIMLSSNSTNVIPWNFMKFRKVGKFCLES